MSALLTQWDEVDQQVGDMAVRQWRIHLLAGIKAKDSYFECGLP